MPFMCSSLGRKHARLDLKRSATALQPVLPPGGEAFSVVARLSPHPLHGFSSAVLFIHAWLDVGDDLRDVSDADQADFDRLGVVLDVADAFDVHVEEARVGDAEPVLSVPFLFLVVLLAPPTSNGPNSCSCRL